MGVKYLSRSLWIASLFIVFAPSETLCWWHLCINSLNHILVIHINNTAVSTLHSRLASISSDCANIFSQEGGVDETPCLCCWCWLLLIDWQDSAARYFAFELPSEDPLQSWKSCESMHLVLHVNWTAGHTDRSTRRARHNHSTKPSIPPTRIGGRTRERRKAKKATPSLFVKCSMGYAI